MPDLQAQVPTASPSLNGMREDLLIFDAAYGVIICEPCQYALVPRTVAGHLRAQHRRDEGLTAAQIRGKRKSTISHRYGENADYRRISLPRAALIILSLVTTKTAWWGQHH